MNIGVIGLGVVGAVTAGAVASKGHDVFCFDLNQDRLGAVTDGRSPFPESGLDNLLHIAHGEKHLRRCGSVSEVANDCSLCFVSVATPINGDGNGLIYEQIVSVCKEIASTARRGVLVVVRSTVGPGVTRDLIEPCFAGTSCSVALSPEFLREGEAVKDFWRELCVVATPSGCDSEAQALIDLYRSLGKTPVVTHYEVAELLKMTCNSWHALKVAFANEIGRICHATGVDSQELMKVFSMDTLLNISAAYLKPGFAYGGSCLSKDTRALAGLARERRMKPVLLEAIETSNDQHIERAAEVIFQTGRQRVGLVGLSHKPGTGDLRQSQMIALAKKLTEMGLTVKGYDAECDAGERTVKTLEDLVQWSEVLAVFDKREGFAVRAGQIVVDLTGKDRAAVRIV